jgi:hypothetical protein
MRLKITVGFAALALATAFASAPTFAQGTPGYSSNGAVVGIAQGIPGYSTNGAVVAIHHHRHQASTKPLYNSASKHKQNTPSGPAPRPSPNDAGIIR